MYYLQGSYLANRFDHVPASETFRNAEMMLKKCIELDAVYAPAYSELSYLYHNHREYRATTDEEKKRYLNQQENTSKKATELNPDLPEVLYGKAWMHWAKGETDALFKTLRSDSRIVMYESWLLVLKGQANEAARGLEKIPDDAYAKLVVDILSGSTESAVAYMVERQKKEAMDYTISRFLHLKNHPLYDPLRVNPRFQQVVEQEREKYSLVLKHYGYEK